MNTPTAIQTEYAGHLFRSRLEARWAVFFTKLEIEWQYEPQGYSVGGVCDQDPPRKYLPDFYLPGTQTWVEVKGNADQFDWDLLADCVEWGRGLPGTDESYGTSRGLLLLGPIPNVARHAPIHPILQHYKGGFVRFASFVDNALVVSKAQGEFFDTSGGQGIGDAGEQSIRQFFPGTRHWVDLYAVPTTYRLIDAYRAARSARFEHGQAGGTLPPVPRPRKKPPTGRPW